MTQAPSNSLFFLSARNLCGKHVEGLSEFSVKLKNGSLIKVHTYILSSKSDVLANMVKGDFKEKKEKTIQFPNFSDHAVKTFIKFLYGFNLRKEDLKLDIVKELLQIGEMYNVKSLTNAASVAMNDYLTKENVFELWKFCKDINAEDSLKTCGEFVVKNFDRKTLHKNEKILKLPELLCWMLNYDQTNHQRSSSIFRACGPRKLINFSQDTSAPISSSLSFVVDADIDVTGVGILILPGSEIFVEVKIDQFIFKTEVFNYTDKECFPVLFNGVKKAQKGVQMKVMVNIIGSGAGVPCHLDVGVTKYTSGGTKYKKEVSCLSVSGNSRTLVHRKFSCIELGGSCLIQEIYFKA